MNNKHLSKAKRIDNGEWIVGNLIYSEDTDKDFRAIIIPVTDSDMYVDRDEKNLGFENWFKVDESTICQCTGREDEWEHDVFYCDDTWYEIEFCKESLTWDAVSVFSSESIELGEFDPEEYVKLGNSIDNPELLEPVNDYEECTELELNIEDR